jgi:hypothetical protein
MAQPNQVQIRAKDDDLKGNYSNAMQVSHTQEEFVLDFFNVHTQGGQGMLVSRIVLSPGHAKRIQAALEDNLKKYEGQFGQIKAAEGMSQEMGFKG